ncbi:YbhB/YbcL family Raf kinase inhibitor-like protein [Bacillus sp. Marseille-P3661]|uniref:YbhB/YbcL family Raf kinase inhibitor-like protein n=1 Tax=Bacillus sp. Marseille-P3661 TaxID=1936234 RepID=UPI000C84A596|nr:YbhB/YbcL family Raf kinase inhibitor-like protein [Bacillus sp. Marseille-P3661]
MKKRRVYKKALQMLLAFLIILPSFSVSFASDDVRGHWAEAEINEWVTKGLASGYADGSFRPDAAISRAEFFALVNRSLQFTETAEISFKDVSANDWFFGEIGKAKAAGYAGGYEDGTIRPTEKISRQEVAAILSRIQGIESDASVASQLKDAKEIPEWSKGIIGGVVAKGYMRGFSDGSFKPLKNITRAEAIVTLNRVLIEQSPAVKVFDQAGTYGPESGTETIAEDVVITAANVTLQNTIVAGNLTIAESVGEGDVFLKGVTVKGNTYVNGGGENSIHFENTVLLTVVVNKADGSVRIVASGTTTVQEVQLQSGARVEQANTGGVAFRAVTLSETLPANSTVTLVGDFETVDVRSTTVSVEIPQGSVQNLNVNETATGASINLSEEARIVSLVIDAAISVLGNGTVDNATVNSNGTTFGKNPSNLQLADGVTTTSPTTSTPAGGGGGSSTPSDTAAPTFTTTDVFVTPGNDFIVIPFNEHITANVTALKNNIKIAGDGTTFTDLGANDDVFIGIQSGSEDHRNRLIVYLSAALTGNQTKIKVLANTVKDTTGNVQSTELITGALTAHTLIPAPPDPTTTPSTITITTGFNDGQPIPPQYSMNGGNTSLPVSWTPVVGAQSYAILFYDPDAMDFVHWAVKNIPAGVTAIAEDLSEQVGFPGHQFINDFGIYGYGGPQPPVPHTYKLAVYALNVPTLDLDTGAIPVTKVQFDGAIAGKVIVQAEITGTFNPGVPPGPVDSTPPSIVSITSFDENSSGTWDPYTPGVKDKFIIVFSEDLANDSKIAIETDLKRPMDMGDSYPPPVTWIGADAQITWVDNKTLEIVMGGGMLFPGEHFILSKEAVYDLSNNKPDSNIQVNLPAPASLPPRFDVMSPRADAGTNNGEIQLSVDLDQTGTVYYVVVPKDAAAPTVDQVIAGASYDAVTVEANGMIAVTDPDQEAAQTVTGLTPGSSYDIYFVAQDAEVPPNVLNEVKNVLNITAKSDGL